MEKQKKKRLVFGFWAATKDTFWLGRIYRMYFEGMMSSTSKCNFLCGKAMIWP